MILHGEIVSTWFIIDDYRWYMFIDDRDDIDDGSPRMCPTFPSTLGGCYIYGVDTRPHRFADGSPRWKTPPASRYTLATGQTAICHPTKMNPLSKWVIPPVIYMGYPHLWDEILVISSKPLIWAIDHSLWCTSKPIKLPFFMRKMMMNGGILGYPILRHSENPGSLGPTYPGTDPQPLLIGQKNPWVKSHSANGI